MKLTESINNCYISHRVGCTNKIDVRKTFMGNYNSLKCLCGEWTPVR